MTKQQETLLCEVTYYQHIFLGGYNIIIRKDKLFPSSQRRNLGESGQKREKR